MPTDAAEEAVVLGQTAAEVLKKKVGDPIQIDTKELKVVGIVKGGALVGRRVGDPFPATLAGNSWFSQPNQCHRHSRDSFDYRATDPRPYPTDPANSAGSPGRHRERAPEPL